MRTAGSAGTPQVSFGPCVSPRFGRPSTPLATYLWLVFAFLREWGRLAGAITRIAVTRQRIRTAGGLVPTTLRITGAPAGQAVAGAEKGLVNARRAVLRAVDNLMQLPVTSTTTAFRGTGTRCAISPGALDQHPQTGTPMGPHPDRTRQRKPGTWTGHRILAHNLVKSPAQPKNPESKINNSAEPADCRPRAPQQPPADFFRGK